MTPKLSENATREKKHEYLETKVSPRTRDIVWVNVVVFMYYHLAAGYLYLVFTQAMWTTIRYSMFVYWLSALGVTAGAHRLWAHRSYKVQLPLQVFLMLCHSLANQHTVAHWVRLMMMSLLSETTDCITSIDPHNARRGLFYSHIGWLLVRKQDLVKEKGKGVDLSDINDNPILRFQARHGNWFIPTIAFIIPTSIPYWWGEALFVAFHLNMLRYIICLNATFMINSVAHKWGYKPYDKSIMPNQSVLVSAMTLGEGFHNFQHLFSDDYKASELGNIVFNYVTIFIDCCAYFGLAYDLREAPREVIESRRKRTGVGETCGVG